ncbi:ABC transporter permease [Mannheimia sp. AT1]|uniref:ABC transporter permease n=1 Tax=Mannheimia cairinae TaxID=3025936 RepID=A0ABT5MT78_9PAST|nr:ABC transporter permease [Mannheimia cairinae]MDD0824709.1 ABC transporter permease [Mannheimia cairinae]MDD0826362.1 ABC transporter permease [Mannheimia cairinae]
MPIKFVDLLQQSWNFMRNQQVFSLFAIITISVVQLLVIFLLANDAGTISQQQIEQQQVEPGQMLAFLLPTMLLGVINLFINLLMILNIQSINNGSYQQFFQNTGNAIKSFLPVLLLQIVMILPFSLGLSFAMTSPEMIIVAFPLILVGFYFFFKLSLLIYVYLLEKPQKTVLETIKFTLQLSRGKMMPLVLFCVISYVVPGILSRFVAMIGNGSVGTVISIILSAFISVFMAIFSFRFYQVYRQLPANN